MAIYDPITGATFEDPTLGTSYVDPAGFPPPTQGSGTVPGVTPEQLRAMTGGAPLPAPPPPPLQPVPTQAPGTMTERKVSVSGNNYNDDIAGKVSDFIGKNTVSYGHDRQAISKVGQLNADLAKQTGIGREKALQGTYEAQARAKEHTATAQSEYQTESARIDADFNAKHQQLQEEPKIAQAKWAAAQEKLAATKIDPSRLARDNRMSFAVASFMDGFLGAKGIRTGAMDNINKAIDRDLEGQKANMENQRAVTDGYRQAWEASRQVARTEEEHQAFMRTTYLNSAAAELDRKKLLANSPVEAAQHEAAATQIRAEANKGTVDAINQTLNSHLSLNESNRKNAMDQARLAIERRQIALAEKDQADRLAAEKAKAKDELGTITVTDENGEQITLDRREGQDKEWYNAQAKIASDGQPTLSLLRQGMAASDELGGRGAMDKIATGNWASGLNPRDRREKINKLNVVLLAMLRDESGAAIKKDEQATYLALSRDPAKWTDEDAANVARTWSNFQQVKAAPVVEAVRNISAPRVDANGRKVRFYDGFDAYNRGVQSPEQASIGNRFVEGIGNVATEPAGNKPEDLNNYVNAKAKAKTGEVDLTKMVPKLSKEQKQLKEAAEVNILHPDQPIEGAVDLIVQTRLALNKANSEGKSRDYTIGMAVAEDTTRKALAQLEKNPKDLKSMARAASIRDRVKSEFAALRDKRLQETQAKKASIGGVTPDDVEAIGAEYDPTPIIGNKL